MIILNLKLDGIYGFDGFDISFTYPKKVVNSIIDGEYLEGRERFRYKKAVVLMGANATGKTSLGKTLLKIITYVNTGSPAVLYDMVSGDKGEFQIDFVNHDFTMHRIHAVIDVASLNVEVEYKSAEIDKMDSYEKCVNKLCDHTAEATKTMNALKEIVGPVSYRFAYPKIETSLNFDGINKTVLTEILRAVIGTLDPTLKDVTISKDLKDTFIIRRRNAEIIIQEGKLLNREVLSSGTTEGVDVAIFLAAMMAKNNTFYYCDEMFTNIHSAIEKRIFGLMLECLTENEQLIFTTHNTDMLDLNLPKHSYILLRRRKEDNYRITSISTSALLKRNTDSVRCAVENDVFGSVPDDSMLDELTSSILIKSV